MKTAITPTREQNFPEWYQQVIKHADLAESSPVRGCMVIKPWGYALWQNLQRQLDIKIEATGHENIYLPLFIPLSHMEKEAKHVEGFAKECAVVTHHRLEEMPDGHLKPAGELDEPLVIRPTSEAIIGEMFSKWVQSYRDLPILMNQWANIVRWEMRTRLFLRTTEFLWQEGHTAHACAQEAQEESLKMLEVYRWLAEEILAIPVIKGEKTKSETFPGADNTYTIEAMMQDGKALQAGTSHFLGQNFAKTFEIKYLDKDNKAHFAWTTSWGVSTRLIGALIMTHSDDDGLIIPPRIAHTHIVILPTVHKGDAENILAYCEKLAATLRTLKYHDQPIKVKIDTSDETTGTKAWHWVKKGVPVRIEVGPREVENNAVFVGYRHKPYKERTAVDQETFIDALTLQLDEMQNSIFERAKTFQTKNTITVDSQEAFYDFFKKQTGFVVAYFVEDEKIEKQLKDDLKVTTRCMPFAYKEKTGRCIFTGREDGKLTVFAKAY
ncbi:MAG: proline--tRNA ligase [Gammaproteobacteria bacterium RIFCSPHIGHO2_12_FULL_41_15]|nr:MAG: proline--tRNA ligase [Gammaproteobacteria bacterium RIFCSPHIGHO2_12_FULL_41_15]